MLEFMTKRTTLVVLYAVLDILVTAMFKKIGFESVFFTISLNDIDRKRMDWKLPFALATKD